MRRFYVLLTVHLDTSVCNENQLALFILSLFRQSTSTCFERIVAHHHEVYCIYTTRINCCTYRVHLLMMGYRYVRNI